MNSVRYFKKLNLSLLIAFMLMHSQSVNADSFDGLSLVEKTKHKIVYIKPEADFSTYSKIKLMPVHVAFKKNWQRNYNNEHRLSGGKVREKDIIRIKKELSEMFDHVFSKEFTENGYPIIDVIEDNVLLVRPALINLDVNAPDVLTAANSKTYTQSAGSVTVYLELYDAISGEILARVAESKQAGDRRYFDWANKATNRADARKVLQHWATKFRKYLDSAHKNDKLKAPIKQ